MVPFPRCIQAFLLIAINLWILVSIEFTMKVSGTHSFSVASPLRIMVWLRPKPSRGSCQNCPMYKSSENSYTEEYQFNGKINGNKQYYHWCKYFFLFSGREPTTWSANNCLQIMSLNCFWLQILFCSCVKEITRAPCSFMRSLPLLLEGSAP